MEKKKITPKEIVDKLIESKKETIREMNEFAKTDQYIEIMKSLNGKPIQKLKLKKESIVMKSNDIENNEISSDEILNRIFREKREAREKFIKFMKNKEFQKMLDRLDPKPIKKHVRL